MKKKIFFQSSFLFSAPDFLDGAYFLSLLGNSESHYDLRIYFERKEAHIFEYFFLFILAFRLFRRGFQRDRISAYRLAFHSGFFIRTFR